MFALRAARYLCPKLLGSVAPAVRCKSRLAGGGLADSGKRTSCDDRGNCEGHFLARHAADCGLLVLCSLNEHPARMGVQNGFCKRSLLQAGGHVPLSSPSNYYARVAHTIPLGGMFPCGGTCCLCPSLLGRWLWCDADLKLPNYGSPCGHALWSIIERWSHALHL